MPTKAVYPGTFDPPTLGHLDIIKRAHELFDELVVAVAESSPKKTLFSTEERLALMKDCLKNSGLEDIEVVSFSGLLIDFVKCTGAKVIIRGLRAISDFEYEFQMALANRTLETNIDTVFLMTNPEYSFFSASLIKEIAKLGGNLSKFVPKNVEKALVRKFSGLSL